MTSQTFTHDLPRAEKGSTVGWGCDPPTRTSEEPMHAHGSRDGSPDAGPGDQAESRAGGGPGPGHASYN